MTGEPPAACCDTTTFLLPASVISALNVTPVGEKDGIKYYQINEGVASLPVGWIVGAIHDR